MNLDFYDEYEVIAKNLVQGGIDYVKTNPGVKVLVVGMSGGVDSTVTAKIARMVADATDIKLHGLVMPCASNHHEETMRGILAASHLCHEHHTVHIDRVLHEVAAHIEPDLLAIESERTHEMKVRLGNMKARIRMITGYNWAAKNNGLVLSTDNLTELLVGFWTLHGDVGDFGFLQNLWKTEVFGLADYFGGDCAEAAAAKPTDGLGVSNSDLDQLLPGWDGTWRAGYKQVDEVLMDYLKADYCRRMRPFNGYVYKPIYKTDHPVIQRHLRTKYKRENPFNLSRDVALSGLLV